MALLDTSRAELLDATDEQIEDAIGYADLVALRGLLYQLTGDEEVAAAKTKLIQAGFGNAAVIADEETEAMIRRKTVEFLKKYRDEGAPPIESGPPERLDQSIALAVARELEGDAVGYMREELALDPWARSLDW